jgi:N-acetylmuramic acid 6-phosphate etherase
MTLSTAKEKAAYFLKNEKEFHLGKLVTESQHPKTMNFSKIVQEDLRSGLKMLFSVDEDIIPVYRKTLNKNEFNKLVESFYLAAIDGKRICFSGCGSTGRLSVLLEAMWRTFWKEAEDLFPKLKLKFPGIVNTTYSIMTGGDFALIQSLENFEDFQMFGKQQVKEAKLKKGDVMVAISEGGETSSVIGTAWQALESGSKVFFIYNNPTDIIAKYLPRSRKIIEEKKITKLDLTTGPMTIAGSTRMQAITIELLVIATALELVITKILKNILTVAELHDLNIVERDVNEYIGLFEGLLSSITSEKSLNALARVVKIEEEVYRQKGFITYLADSFMLDILTDTTERAPTFTLPHFNKIDDLLVPQSWSFVKNPLLPTSLAWTNMLKREPRGLNWDSNLYNTLNAPMSLCAKPPKIDNSELYKFQIGNESDAIRYQNEASAVIIFLAEDEISKYIKADSPFRKSFINLAKNYQKSASVFLSDSFPDHTDNNIQIHIPYFSPKSALKIFLHTAIKLIFNTISTATMARMGRVEKNFMIYVESTNKKLIDRSIRIISELTGLKYEKACEALYETIEILKRNYPKSKLPKSVVMETIKRLKT